MLRHGPPSRGRHRPPPRALRPDELCSADALSGSLATQLSDAWNGDSDNRRVVRVVQLGDRQRCCGRLAHAKY